MSQIPVAGPGIGMVFGNTDFKMLNGSGATIQRGDVLMVDATAVNASTLFFDTVIQTDTSTDQDEAFFCVALANVAAAATDSGLFRFRGMADAQVDTSGLAVGSGLAAAENSDGLEAAAAGDKIVAVSQEASTADGVVQVYFNGIEGLGHKAA